MGETSVEGLSERLCERLGERFGEILCKKLCKMLDPNMLHVYFRKTFRRIQESLNLSQLQSPDECLVCTLQSFMLCGCFRKDKNPDVKSVPHGSILSCFKVCITSNNLKA